MDRNPFTLTRYILSEQQKHKEASGDLSLILAAIGTACKAISSAVRRAGLTGLYGVDGGTNATGDSVKKLDVLSDEIFCNSLRHTRRVALIVSEEQETPIIVEGAEGAKYICVRPSQSHGARAAAALCHGSRRQGSVALRGHPRSCPAAHPSHRLLAPTTSCHTTA